MLSRYLMSMKGLVLRITDYDFNNIISLAN